MVERKAIHFYDDDMELFEKLKKLSEKKGTYKFTQTCIELLRLGIACQENGYQIINNQLVQIRHIEQNNCSLTNRT